MLIGLVLSRKDPAVTRDGGARIRCPKCAWEPGKADRWSCEPGCGWVWNTFDTRGTCPSCDKRWQDTMCLRCSQWSRHADWYLAE